MNNRIDAICYLHVFLWNSDKVQIEYKLACTQSDKLLNIIIKRQKGHLGHPTVTVTPPVGLRWLTIRWVLRLAEWLLIFIGFSRIQAPSHSATIFGQVWKTFSLLNTVAYNLWPANTVAAYGHWLLTLLMIYMYSLLILLLLIAIDY
jgi:hypothetical protein